MTYLAICANINILLKNKSKKEIIMEKSPLQPSEIQPDYTEQASDASTGIYSEEFDRNIIVEPIEGGEIVLDAVTGEELNIFYDGDGEGSL